MSFRRYKSVYTAEQEALIKSEFSRSEGQCYLDHAGATLYSEVQLRNIMDDLTSNIYANPHSQSISSKTTKDSIDLIRLRCLEHFKVNPEEYSLIFTSGATGALKIISHCFNYNGGCLYYLEDNHTSVLGMRENAPNVNALTVHKAKEIFSKPLQKTFFDEKTTENSLFVYPAQCNFSGTKYPLSWIEKIHNGALNNKEKPSNWYCLLDAAAFASTNELDLSKYRPDFVCISFYKIFGYPTGLGALLVRNDSSHVLIKKYYGGGTVLMTVSRENIVKRKTIVHEKFEDGTINYLSILSLKHGFDTLKRLKLSMDLISRHTYTLGEYIYNSLLSLHHSNGAPAVILYNDTSFNSVEHQGGIVNFNLLRANCEYIGYSEVSHIANLFGIHLRTGCFCNPGACQRHLKLDSELVFEHFQKGHVCGDQYDLIDGIPTGSVRISFGYMTTKQDIDKFLSMIEECFVSKPVIRKTRVNTAGNKENHKLNNNTDIVKVSNDFLPSLEYLGKLESIFLYPVKSCGAFQVTSSWEIVKTGLKYDREWMITNSSGVCLTQKNNTNLCKLLPKITKAANSLELCYEGEYSNKLPLNIYQKDLNEAYTCQSKVCSDAILAYDCGDSISQWLQKNLQVSGLKLMRQCLETTKTRSKPDKGELSLANQAQFLLINTKTVEWLLSRINDGFEDTIDGLIRRFRPNFVVNFEEPFVENDMKEFRINNLVFKNVGKCTRCQMICINQVTGEKTVEPLRTLSKELSGKISFGVYLKCDLDCDRNDVDNRVLVESNVIGYC